MKLIKVLIPEIAKKLRSSGNIITDKVFEFALNSLHFKSEGVEVENLNLIDSENEVVFRSCFTQVKRHLVDKAPTYHLCHDFGEALLKLKERDIIEEFLPDKFFAYINFPKDLIKDIEGAYIYIGKADNRTPFKKENRDKKVVWMSFFGSIQADGNFPMNNLSFFIGDGKNISEILDFYDNKNKNESIYDSPDLVKVGNLLLNCVLYLNSQDPIVLNLMPSYNASVSKQKKHTINGLLNCCTIPVKAINWDYTKSKNYQDSTIFINGFLAWRRCGPNHSQIRLSWISEHEKTIKKLKENHNEIFHS